MTTDRNQDLSMLAKKLPVAVVDEQRSRAARASLLTAASVERSAHTTSAKRWLWGLVPVLAAACGLLAWSSLAGNAEPEPKAGAKAVVPSGLRANVKSSHGAHFVHTEDAGDEVVRLTAGRMTVHVAMFEANRRLRVVTSDAVVEVRGAAFDVEVKEDQLREVFVHSGVVEMRPIDRSAVMLSTGERWLADDLVAAASTAKSPPAEAVVAEVASDTPAVKQRRAARLSAEVQPRFASRVDHRPDAAQEKELPEPEPAALEPATDVELMFEDAWQTIASGKYEPAISKLQQTIALAPDGPLSEDARYWLAVAQARSGHKVAARRSMAQFLAKHPRSSRAGEISAMLGWLFIEIGNHEAAAIRFEAALEDANPAVRRSAKSGLDMI